MADLLALTRAVSPRIGLCELTHLPRRPIDRARAEAQHRELEHALEGLGCLVQRIPAAPHLPDSVFLEDIAVVLDEVAVLTRPGAPSRRSEVPAVAQALAPHRRLLAIEPPGTLDGGDVLRVGRDLFVGASKRTNAAGCEQLSSLLKPFGYAIRRVPIRDCLHLKTAITGVADEVVLYNPAWVEGKAFAGYELIEVDASEPFAANSVRVGDTVLYPEAYPRTRRRLEERGLQILTVDGSELAKAEGGLSCCCLIFEPGSARHA